MFRAISFSPPPISAFYDPFSDTSRGPVWDTVAYTPANGSTTENTIELVIHNTAKPFTGGYVTKAAYVMNEAILGCLRATLTNNVAQFLISPEKITAQNPADQAQNLYRVQQWLSGASAQTDILRRLNGTNSSLYSALLSSAKSEFVITIAAGNIYFYINGVLLASQTYALASRALYVYLLGEMGGTIGQDVRIDDPFMVVNS